MLRVFFCFPRNAQKATNGCIDPAGCFLYLLTYQPFNVSTYQRINLSTYQPIKGYRSNFRCIRWRKRFHRSIQESISFQERQFQQKRLHPHDTAFLLLKILSISGNSSLPYRPLFSSCRLLSPGCLHSSTVLLKTMVRNARCRYVLFFCPS